MTKVRFVVRAMKAGVLFLTGKQLKSTSADTVTDGKDT
jgi:hypothetical protein